MPVSFLSPLPPLHAGQRHSLRGQPDAAAFRARLQAVAAAQQGELTVELPADFFASPQVGHRNRALLLFCRHDPGQHG